MATRQWTVTAASGTFDFNNPTNWSFGVAPDAFDIAQFSNSHNVDQTVTGNATVAEILIAEDVGAYSLTGTYLISGALPTELSLVGSDPWLTILPGALVDGNQAVSVSGGTLFVEGGLVGSSLSITNAGLVLVYQGAAFDITGPISIDSSSFLIGRPAPNQAAGPAIAIGNAIQASGAATLASEGQEIDFNGVISGSALVTLFGDGQATDIVGLNGNNTFSGGVEIDAINAVTAAVGNAHGLGTGALTLSAGELLATTTETIANQLSLSGNFTIAATHGQTLTLSSPSPWFLAGSSGELIRFGAPGQDGVVVFDETGGAAMSGGGTYGVRVQAGVLKAGDGGLAFLLGNALSTQVQTGATLDLAGFSATLHALEVDGLLTDSGAASTLSLAASDVFGTISGPIAVTIASGGNQMTSANTYTGGTTINAGATLVLGENGASGSVVGPITDNGFLALKRGDTFTLNNVSGSGQLIQAGTGTLILGSGLTYAGGTQIGAGTLAVGDPAALGPGNLQIIGGELLATATETISNALALFGNFTIAAAHGQTLTTSTTQPWSLTGNGAPETISFGATGQDGVVALNAPSGTSIGNPGQYTVVVQAGALKLAAPNAAFLLAEDNATLVQAGATLDIAGFTAAATALLGGGLVTDSGAAAQLVLTGPGSFYGSLTGSLTVVVASGSTTLSGASTNTGGALIDAGATLTLGSNGTSGSVLGLITDNGTLAINRSDTATLNNVTGSGQVAQNGSGTTLLGSGLSFSGGVTINAGVLSVGAPSGLGAGLLTIAGGELLATSTETIANQLAMSGNFTIAAAHGQTLTTTEALPWTLTGSAGEMISFGAAGQDGVVVFRVGVGSMINGGGLYAVTVQAGTLRAGDGGVSFLLANDKATVVQAGATLDVAGIGTPMNGLQGGGHIGNSGGATTLFVGSGDFAGTIGGALALSVSGSLTLTAANAFTGGATINSGAELTLGNGGATGSITGAIVDNGALEFNLSNTLVENGVISGAGQLLQDGSGVTVLTQTNSYAGGTFLDGGTLELQLPGSAGTGAITFLSGGTAGLQIDGSAMPSNQITGFSELDNIDLRGVSANGWSYSGGVLSLLNGGATVAQLHLSTLFTNPDFGLASDGAGGTVIHLEAPNRDFRGNGVSDLLFQNVDGTPAVWLMNGASAIFATNLADPGPSWRLVGTGDFNGDIRSDLVWQNSDGTPAIWLMNGATQILGANLTSPGPSWRLIGTGDLNGDGRSDLVWQNSDGTPAIWLMNGATEIAGTNLPNPGASWHLVGTGDFNGDGKADLLWQNTDGTPAIWLMNGLTQIGGGNLPNPGASWRIVGVGDFNGDGKSDILWQNTDGTPVIWEMNGLATMVSAALPNPGASWHLIGSGDFNGDGKSDLVWQNSDGTPAVWLMNGTSQIFGANLIDPGASWHLVTGH
jgi:autotransporter-associated beta strand protein